MHIWHMYMCIQINALLTLPVGAYRVIALNQLKYITDFFCISIKIYEYIFNNFHNIINYEILLNIYHIIFHFSFFFYITYVLYLHVI